MLKKALIIGSSGQDGQLLNKLLKENNYDVMGLNKESNIKITSFEETSKLIKNKQFNEIYYLAAFHHSSEDEKPDDLLLFKESFEINFFGLINILESIKLYSKDTKLFYAASSHIFGMPKENIQTENTCINPTNIYGISKSSSLFACRYYRNNYGLFVSVGILYNHESILRKDNFLSKKVCKAAIEIANKKKDFLQLFNLNSTIDMGYAEDFVEAMWLILTSTLADDYIISTGQGTSIKKFIKNVFIEVGLDYKKYIQLSSDTNRNNQTTLIGSNQKLYKTTGWKPKTSVKKMIKLLLQNEQKKFKGE